ncbi:MAG: winged helix-turn-helix domain-containing protein [Terriglobia bacterium]|nr:winged helix-turn-helix domain-containing protein [Terriglobia bacterium]
MDSTTPGKELYEFDVFRVDAERETLLRAGEPVALPPKAFQVLLVLVRNSQEVVTKDDLMKEVWPDTFVEEANLSRNIFLLRKALGESPQDHRYVLTVPGRGYRLAERVRLVPDHEASIVAATHSKIQLEVKESQRRWWLGVVAGLLLLGAGATAVWVFGHHKPRLTDRDTIVLSEFANSTGDPVFDETLRRGLAVQLAQSPYLTLISDERMQRTLALMGQPMNAPVSRDAARVLCERTASAAVLEGSINNLGRAYVLGLRATSCSTGDVLAEEQAQAARKEDVLGVLGEMASSFRQRLGESLSSVSKYNTPLPDATTPSLDALRAYSLGWKSTFGATGPAEGIPFFKRAIELDPNFATAYAMIGRTYGELGEANLSAEYTTKAFQLKERTSEPERYFIMMNYEMQVTGNLEKARQAGELWVNAYPRDAHPRGLLSFIYQSLGRTDKAIEAGRAAVELDPDTVPGYANLAWAYVLAEQPQRAEEIVSHASSRGLEFPDLYILLYDIAFLKNDEKGMQRAVAMADGKPGAEHWMAARQACVLAYKGRLKEARALTRRAVLLAQKETQADRGALYLAALATREALFGDNEEAKDAARSAMRLSKTRDVLYGAAFAYAWVGADAQAAPIVDDLQKHFPEDTFVNGIYLPTIRAIMARNHHDSSRADELLHSTAQYELSVPGTWFGFFGMMYPTYVRGMVYLDARQPDKAAAEFKKIVEHRDLVASDPIGALAALQLARSYFMQGDLRQAESQYRNVIAIWKDASLDVPVIRQARAESQR